MLHFLVMADNRSPLRAYLRRWADGLRGRTRLMSYEDIADATNLMDGTYVFTDIERLPPEGLAKAGWLWDGLAARGPRVRLLNSPHAMLRRRELLRALFVRGSNRFNVYALDDPRDGMRFPVFLRSNRQHHGPLSPFLSDAAALSKAIADVLATGVPRWDLLIVEFLDVSVNGIFNKYSVTRIGPAILPQHAFFSDAWVVKSVTRWLPEYVAADNAFLRDNPHRAELDEIFRLAHVDFGRADYAILDGKVQVWEINTNPVFFMKKSFYRGDRLGPKLALAARINAALADLDEPAGGPGLADRVWSYMDLWR
jgi:hypothetical protein